MSASKALRAARAMRDLPKEARDAAIAASDNVIDIRDIVSLLPHQRTRGSFPCLK